jgi:hypothetical protein
MRTAVAEETQMTDDRTDATEAHARASDPRRNKAVAL